MGRKAKFRLAQDAKAMTGIEAAWVSGVWSAFGICSPRGFRQEPSLLMMSRYPYVPRLLHVFTGLGRAVPGGGQYRWVCDHPDEVRAFYAALCGARVRPAPDRLDAIEASWARYREYTILEGSGDDPGPLDPATEAETTATID